MDDRQNQRAGTSAAEVPDPNVALREFTAQLLSRIDGLEQRFEQRIDGLGQRVVGMSAQLAQLSERMEDLEDRDRYSKRAGRFVGAPPRTTEQYRTSAGSINAGRDDVDIFPSLSQ